MKSWVRGVSLCVNPPLRKMVVIARLAFVVVILCILTIAFPAVSRAGHDGHEKSEQAPLYYEVESLNEGLPELDDPPDLTTPRATLVNMIRASQDGDFERAARSLNFAELPKDQRHPELLARKFYYVLTQQVQIDFRNVPDRPNGALDKKISSEPNQDSASGSDEQPRRSIMIDDVPMSLGNVEVRLERFKPHKGDPIWLFSPRTVTKIDAMYERHGPGPLFKHLPYNIKQGLIQDSTGWQWLLLLGLATPAFLVGWGVKKALHRFSLWKFPQQQRHEVVDLARPLGWLVAVVLFTVVNYVFVAAPGTTVHAFYVVSTVLIVACVTWVGIHLIDLSASLVTQKYRPQMGPYEGEETRLWLTSITVGRYVLVFLAIAIGLGLALYELHVIKNLSLSFLTSAGVASAILGVTAHGVLGNVLAGLQIAVTKPAAIGDCINFEGNWGFVEDITYGYVAIRTWDDRRVIVPLSYFITHPFENWSKCDSRIVKPVYLYADYRVEVDKVRQKFRELLEQSEQWDRTVDPVFQVTGMSEKTIELRALCSAKNASDAWDLHCKIRESLVQYLRTMEEGRYLPKDRVEVTSPPEDHERCPQQ